MKQTICLPICVTLILICLNAVTSQRSSSCCLRTKCKNIPMSRVKDYRIQKAGICPIDAIVLLTKKRKEICCDPKSDWTKSVMKMVDEKKMPFCTKQNPKASPDKRQKKNGRKERRQKKIK